MNAHTSIAHSLNIARTPSTKRMDALIAKADAAERAPSPRIARTPAHFAKLMPEQAPYFAGPEALATELYRQMQTAIPHNSLPNEVASRGADLTLRALIRIVYNNRGREPLPTLSRWLGEMEEPFSHKTEATATRMEDAAHYFEEACEQIAADCRRDAEAIRARSDDD